MGERIVDSGVGVVGERIELLVLLAILVTAEMVD